jgi:hypothetical protein
MFEKINKVLLVALIIILFSLGIGYIVYVNLLISELSKTPWDNTNKTWTLKEKLYQVNSKYVKSRLKTVFHTTRSPNLLMEMDLFFDRKDMHDIILKENILLDKEFDMKVKQSFIYFIGTSSGDTRFRPILEQIMVDEKEDLTTRICASDVLKSIGDEGTIRKMLFQIEKYYLYSNGSYSSYTDNLLQAIGQLYGKYRSDNIKTKIVNTVTKYKDDINIPDWQRKRSEDFLNKLSQLEDYMNKNSQIR